MITEYRPGWAPHVLALIEPWEDTEPQRVKVLCEKCSERYQFYCSSGAPRKIVLKWAQHHRHPEKP